MKTVCIVIPAHNEAGRIGRTLERYGSFYQTLAERQIIAAELLVVLNACSDTTRNVVEQAQKNYTFISMIELAEGGKGLAITAGFKHALMKPYDYIGFVDADMATEPRYFQQLVDAMGTHDGVIASRYIKGAVVTPPRPFIKSWGRKIFYHSLVRLLFGLRYKDLQCGAKLFKYAVLAKVTPQLTVRQWAFDVELLYMCKKDGFNVIEIPTVWHDQADSKLRVLRSGLKMLGTLFEIKREHG